MRLSKLVDPNVFSASSTMSMVVAEERAEASAIGRLRRLYSDVTRVTARAVRPALQWRACLNSASRFPPVRSSSSSASYPFPRASQSVRAARLILRSEEASTPIPHSDKTCTPTLA